MHTHDGSGSSAELTSHAIVLFDGVCNVCNDSVKFILARDPAGYFRFASLQSEIAKGLLSPFGLAEMPLHTMALIEGGRTRRISCGRVCDAIEAVESAAKARRDGADASSQRATDRESSPAGAPPGAMVKHPG